MLMNDLTDKARKVFAGDRYATGLTGIEIASVEDGKAACTLTIQHEHCNARGVAMGGVLYTLADFTAAIAANSGSLHESATDAHGSTPLHWVSLDATVHYLSPAPLGARLVARSEALKQGRTTALYQTIIESPDDGKRVTIVETTMIYA